MNFDTQVLILNWNGGADTAACVRSVLDAEASVTIFDNASTDNSLAAIREVAAAAGITVRELELADIAILRHSHARLHLVHSPQNIGFAKGINRMLSEFMHHTSVTYAWLLNNDAFATPDTLPALKETITSAEDIAFAGSVILDDRHRDTVQCCGVDYYKYFGVGKLLLKGRQWTSVRAEELGCLRPVFQHGASLLVKMQHLGRIGLMDEQFFLYAEEHDWQVRAKEMGFANRLSHRSVVYHKGSVSTVDKRHLFYYHYNMSSVYFSRKHYPALVNIIASVMLTGITVVRARMNPKSIGWGLRGIFEGWKMRLP